MARPAACPVGSSQLKHPFRCLSPLSPSGTCLHISLVAPGPHMLPASRCSPFPFVGEQVCVGSEVVGRRKELLLEKHALEVRHLEPLDIPRKLEYMG